MLAEERHPMPATSRRALITAALVAPLLAAPVAALASMGACPSPADFESAIAEVARLRAHGAALSRAAIARGGSVDAADAADEPFQDRADQIEDWIMYTPPACAKGAVVKLRHMLTEWEPPIGSAMGDYVRSVLMWLERA